MRTGKYFPEIYPYGGLSRPVTRATSNYFEIHWTISFAGRVTVKMPAGLDIERLYDEHVQPLYAFLLNLTRDEADTRDLLQEIFVKLARDEKLLRGVRVERAFLIRLAHNAAIDLMRRRGTRERTRENFAAEMVSPFAPADDPDETTFRNELSGALAELPPEQRFDTPRKPKSRPNRQVGKPCVPTSRSQSQFIRLNPGESDHKKTPGLKKFAFNAQCSSCRGGVPCLAGV